MAEKSGASHLGSPKHPGARIRERRVALGLRQKTLAQSVGISASYLNLIEHDRRRIGGRLLNDIARRLDVDPLQLVEGAQNSLIEGLENVAGGQGANDVPGEAASELAQRFPGWARLILNMQARIEAQTRQIAGLSDRLSQDPQLAASMHEVLSVATAIRSTAGILGAEQDLDTEWLARFHRNIYEDSQRLAEGTRGLVAYLDRADEPADSAAPLPQEELETWMAARGYHVRELEDGSATPEELAAALDETARASGSYDHARVVFAQYQDEANQLPLDRLVEAVDTLGPSDPLAIADKLNLSFSLVLRRMACLPKASGVECGLLVCDASGAILFHRPVDGFAVPRFGQACPLLPLYAAFGQLRRPLREIVEPAGYAPRSFLAFAEAEPIFTATYGAQPVTRSTMLLIPVADGRSVHERTTLTGPGCRLCSRRGCPARREPSVLMQHR